VRLEVKLMHVAYVNVTIDSVLQCDRFFFIRGTIDRFINQSPFKVKNPFQSYQEYDTIAKASVLQLIITINVTSLTSEH